MQFTLAYSDLDFISRYIFETSYGVIYQIEAAPGSTGGSFVYGVVQKLGSDTYQIMLVIRDRCFISVQEYQSEEEIQNVSHSEIRDNVAALLQKWWNVSSKVS